MAFTNFPNEKIPRISSSTVVTSVMHGISSVSKTKLALLTYPELSDLQAPGITTVSLAITALYKRTRDPHDLAILSLVVLRKKQNDLRGARPRPYSYFSDAPPSFWNRGNMERGLGTDRTSRNQIR